jgi:predicted branched-subunit amino acid permease
MEKPFRNGFKGMLPITPGIIPFGAIMGSVCADANLTFFQSVGMNLLAFAGAAQLASVDLMRHHTASIVVLLTGLIINLRFVLYSAALSPVVRSSPFLVKLVAAYLLTDQNYAVMSAHQEKLKTKSETLIFYFGASLCMFLTWNFSVIAGFGFGNFVPGTWALDYAVPLSFAALVMPTLKNRKYVIVALFSATTSILLNPMPYRLGLITTALLSVGLGTFLSRRREPA